MYISLSMVGYNSRGLTRKIMASGKMSSKNNLVIIITLKPTAIVQCYQSQKCIQTLKVEVS